MQVKDALHKTTVFFREIATRRLTERLVQTEAKDHWDLRQGLGDFIEDRDSETPVLSVTNELLREDLNRVLKTLSQR